MKRCINAIKDMFSTCKNCNQQFEISEADLSFYEKISPVINAKKIQIPAPDFCPACRQQRRLIFRNESNLYKRKCYLTGQDIISIYSPDKPYKVYQKDVWSGDKWSALDFGRDFDSNRPFFEQFAELVKAVPHPAMGYNENNENCEYTSYQNHSRNCYLTFGSGWMEDCAYASWTYHAKDSFDCLGSNNLELCYEMVDCDRMYNCKNCQDCSDLTDCGFCYDCHSCNNCFGCAGLRRKQYCLFNEQLSPEIYREKIKNIDNRAAREKLKNLKEKAPHKFCFQLNCENCVGDRLANCKNVFDSFCDTDSEDCRYEYDIIKDKDCHDCARTGISEVCYEVVGGGFYYNNLFCVSGGNIKDCFYTFYCHNSNHLFGCVGARNNQYCILNKQYTRDAFDELMLTIIEHMKKTGEWGEFFPVGLAPFAYNETLAQDFFPLNKETALQKGYKWKDPDLKEYMPQKFIFPQDISKVDNSILSSIFACEKCGKNYKLIAPELNFYKKSGVQIPHFCPSCRHTARMAQRNPRRLFERNCGKCGKKILSTFSPQKPDVVYCEACYLKEI